MWKLEILLKFFSKIISISLCFNAFFFNVLTWFPTCNDFVNQEVIEFFVVPTNIEWCNHILEELQWEGPVFKTSGLTAEGTKDVVYYLMDQIEQQREREVEDPEYAAEMKEFRDQLEAETREQTIAAKEAYREMRRAQRLGGDDFDDEDDDDSDVEVYYVR